MERRVSTSSKCFFAALAACLLITTGFARDAQALAIGDAVEFLGGWDYGFVNSDVMDQEEDLLPELFSAEESVLWSSTDFGEKISMTISNDPGSASSTGAIHLQDVGGMTNLGWTAATAGWEISNWTGASLSSVYILLWEPTDQASGVRFASPNLGVIDVAPNSYQPEGYYLGAIPIGSLPANSSFTTYVDVSYVLESGVFETEMINGEQTAMMPPLIITAYSTAFSVVPEPGTALLVVTGLLGLAIKGRRPRCF